MTSFPARLITASNLAYNINDNGSGFALPADDFAAIKNKIGLIGTPQIYQAENEDGIDACYVAETATECFLVFRGTIAPNISVTNPNDMLRSLLDWLNDGKIDQVKGDKLPGLVHAGFLASLDNLWQVIDLSWLAAANANGKKLYITGHSKGGGLAFLAAQRLLVQQINVAGVYTFAAPRVGDQVFALAYDASLKKLTFRFEYQDDIVPHIPPHTGCWLQTLQSAGKISAVVSAEDANAKSAFDGLVNRLQIILKRIADHSINLDSYVSVGTLRFIDWTAGDRLPDDSWALAVKRELHLAELFLTLQFKTIIEDHFSSAGHGYMDYPYPELPAA